MHIHAEDEYHRFQFHDGALFVRFTHVEEAGKHCVVITTDEENQPKLTDHVKEITDYFRGLPPEREVPVKADDLAYYERQPDGDLYRVNIAEMEARGPEHVPFREKASALDVRDKLGTAKLPETEWEIINRIKQEVGFAPVSVEEPVTAWGALTHSNRQFSIEGKSAAQARVWETDSASRRERPTFILQDIGKGDDPALQDSKVLDQCVRQFCEAREIRADTADWFLSDRDRELHEVSIAHARVKEEDPRFTGLKENDLLNIHTRDDAKTAFPDRMVDVPRTSLRSTEPDGNGGLSGVLAEAERRLAAEQDLSQQYTRSR